jgi:hypothetical protein
MKVAITRTEESVPKTISTPRVRSINWKELLGKHTSDRGSDHLHGTLGVDGFRVLSAHWPNF